MKRGHSFWAKYPEAKEVIDIHGLFSDYWSSDDQEFIVLSQSLTLTGPRRSDREEQRPLSLGNIVGL